MDADKVPLLDGDEESDYAEEHTIPSASLNTEKMGNDERRNLLESEDEEVEIIFDETPDRSQTTVGNMSSMMHLIKGNVGTGILAMPSAIKYAGLWVGFFGLGLIGIIAIHCMHLLVQASKSLCEKAGVRSLDYGEVAEQAFYYGPGKLRTFSRAAKVTVNVFICITQFGFCIVYVLFVAQNIQQFVESVVSLHLPIQVYEAMLLVFLIPYSFVKSLKYLAPFSLFANIITFIGLIVILQYCIRDLPSIENYPAFNSWKELPLFFGIAIYAFEGIAVVLPVENKMRTPEAFPGLSGVLNTSMVIVTAMYMAVGFYGYLKFGEDISGSITLNLPTHQALYLAVKLLFALAIFISYGLQFYVPAVVVFPVIARRSCLYHVSDTTADNLLRVIFVLSTFVLAAIVPHLDLMISLIGALASSALALIFPPLIEIITLWPNGFGACKWRLIKDVAITIFGLIGFMTGTATTLIQIIDRF